MPWQPQLCTLHISPVPFLLPPGFLLGWGFFVLAVCWRMQKCQAWGEFPSLTLFQPCGGGWEGEGHLTVWFGMSVAFPCAQAHVSLESSCPRAPRCFPDLHYRGSRGRNKPLFPSKARNCVDGHAQEKQHPWATTAPGMGMLPVSTDIPQLPGPGVCAGLGQAPLLRGFAGSRRILGSVPPFKASPDLDSLPARA